MLKGEPLEFILDTQLYWDGDRRLWTIPHSIAKCVGDGTLWIDGERLPDTDYKIEGESILLLNDDMHIRKSTRAVIRLHLTSQSVSDTFRERVILAVVAIVPALLALASPLLF